jgi:uroporphyrinogen decarboxylase
MTSDEDISEINSKRMTIAASLKEPDQVPVSIVVVTDWCAEFSGLRERMVYFCPDLLLEATLKARRRFRGLVTLKPDFSVVIEPSALGCKIRWPEDTTPWVFPIIREPSDVDALEIPDPYRDGLMAASIDVYHYLEQKIAERGLKVPVGMPYGLRGPFTLAGMLASLDRLVEWMHSDASAAHALLKKCTETVIAWGKVQRAVSGMNFPVFLADDYSGFISRKQFEAFSQPYIRRIFEALDHPLNTYHNDAQTSQLLESIPGTNAKIFHMGPEDMVSLKEAKQKIGTRVCLMGNVHPSGTLISGTPHEVEDESRKCIQTAAQGGGFILAPGGVVGRGVPAVKGEALIIAAEKFGKYPISFL